MTCPCKTGTATSSSGKRCLPAPSCKVVKTCCPRDKRLFYCIYSRWSSTKCAPTIVYSPCKWYCRNASLASQLASQ